MFYFGENSAALDGKSRAMIPVEFRKVMEREKHTTWYLTRGFDGAIFMFHAQQWEVLREQAAAGATLDPRMLDYRRLLLGSVAEVKPDPQGRIVIPPHLREYAQITAEAIMIGVGDHIELWSKEGWRKFQERQLQEYKNMASQLFGAAPKAEETGGNGHAAD